MTAGPRLPWRLARRFTDAVAGRLPAWGYMKEALLVAALALAGGSFVVSTWTALAAWRGNGVIAGLLAGRDLPAGAGSRPEVRIARAQFLLQHDRIDEAQAIVAEIKAAGEPRPEPALLANLQYNIANARMRAAFVLIERNRIDAATSLVGLAKDGYRAALTIDPGHWDARYNLDVAMRLVRDFSPIEQNPEETSQEPPKHLWTDLPGTPKGLP
jgi:mxaK protein